MYPSRNTSDLADDVLARLAEGMSRREGCKAATSLHDDLLERYARSGWANVARASLRRCGQNK